MAQSLRVLDFKLPQDSKEVSEVDYRLAAGVFRGASDYLEFEFTIGLIRIILVSVICSGAGLVGLQVGHPGYLAFAALVMLIYSVVELAELRMVMRRTDDLLDRLSAKIAGKKESK